MGTRRLHLAEYDPAWPGRYEAEREAIEGALGDLVVEVHHIGSTAVPGLVAKPIVDILLGIRRLDVTDGEVAAMASLGFEYLGEYGIPLRRYFARRDSCHVHAFRVGEGQWTAHLLFRDYLRSDPAARDRYAAAKLELAERVGWDRDRYVDEKEHVVDGLLREAQERLP
jgi:GrpB-like predicted nucleotidyltransferase (UPF0157 family)